MSKWNSEEDLTEHLQEIIQELTVEERFRDVQIKKHYNLLYKVTVRKSNSRLTYEPESPERASRGFSAFQTDLCIIDSGIPRVIIEIKLGLTTHDIITYSNKAGRHKQIYPCLRYGLITTHDYITERFFIHNEYLDFYLTIGKLINVKCEIKELIKAEIEASRFIDKAIKPGMRGYTLYKTNVVLKSVN